MIPSLHRDNPVLSRQTTERFVFEPLPDRQRTIERLCDRYSGQHDGLLRNWTPMGGGIADEHRYTITREQYHSSNPEH